MNSVRFNMNEEDFIEAIDSSLFSRSKSERDLAVDVARSISDNALLMILFEIASSDTQDSERLELLEYVDRSSSSPVVMSAVLVVRDLIQRGSVDGESLRRLLDDSSRAPGTYNALGIVEIGDSSFSSRCESLRKLWRKGDRASQA